MGHDPDIKLPHVPGHELAGLIDSVGKDVAQWKAGDRVTLPFVGGCGECPECHRAIIKSATINSSLGSLTGARSPIRRGRLRGYQRGRAARRDGFVTAASLGCRFVTSFRAIVDQGRVAPGNGSRCTAAAASGFRPIMIASADGANVVAVDIADDKLALARDLGAVATSTPMPRRSQKP